MYEKWLRLFMTYWWSTLLFTLEAWSGLVRLGVTQKHIYQRVPDSRLKLQHSAVTYLLQSFSMVNTFPKYNIYMDMDNFHGHGHIQTYFLKSLTILLQKLLYCYL